MDDAWEIARMVGLDKDIEDMPMGMHTIVNEGGTNLSGGQCQRLLIARAIANKPAIVFLTRQPVCWITTPKALLLKV